MPNRVDRVDRWVIIVSMDNYATVTCVLRPSFLPVLLLLIFIFHFNVNAFVMFY